jgi:hypothetical protein
VVRWSLLALTFGLAACGPGPRPPSPATVARAATAPVWRAQADPTVLGPRLVPETLDPSTSFGTEPGGGARFIAGGLRVLRLPNGGILTSGERFPDSADAANRPKAFALPTRLGGGSLFVVEKTLLRSDSWLSEAHPIYTSPTDIADVWLGLDRLYVRAKNGSQVAVDPRRGAAPDLGPWPSAPSVTSYRALDGWRAAAIADLRGAVASFDAGATWRPIALPVEPQRVAAARVDPASGETYEVPAGAGVAGDFLFVRGPEAAHQCFALLASAPAAKLSTCPSRDPPPEAAAVVPDPAALKVLGPSTLLAAVEDGWPIEDGTALVARDGALGRVRLSDGVVVALRLDAFPSKPSRCHPLSLLVDAGAPALGFACAEPRGKTVIYASDPSRMELSAVKTFEGAREVLSFANGAVAVRGACEVAVGESVEGRYCVLSKRPDRSGGLPRWAEIRAPIDLHDDRLIVGSRGTIAFLTPPRGKIDDAHLTFLDRNAKPLKLAFPPVPPDVLRALETGVWLDGFEERDPGVFAGWVEASGAMLGVQVGEDGQVRVGTYVRDAGSPMVSGRYGLGWGANRGYQTTDGGMTWNTLELPKPLSPAPRERACGPVGCTAAGWIRVGWGPSGMHASELPSPTRFAYRPPRDLDLDLECEPIEAMPPATPAPEVGFYGQLPPAARAEDEILRINASAIDRSARVGAVARMFAWGPRLEDWAHVGRWSVQWLWPYGGSREVRTTSPSFAPFTTLDAARRTLAGPGSSTYWSVAFGDDATTALLIGKRPGVVPEVTGVLALEADRAPVELHRADGEPFADVDFAVRTGGHWYLVTEQANGEPRAAVVYRVDGAEAREFARVPRASLETRPPMPRLARRTDGRAIGVVVEGQPSPDNVRWVLPLDVETGVAGEPEPLGSADLGDRTKLLPCTDEDTGWALDTTWSGPSWSAQARVDLGRGRVLNLKSLFVRVRLSTRQACVEEVSGTEADAGDTVAVGAIRPGIAGAASQAAGARATHPRASLLVSVLQGHSRYPLRCHAR